MAVFIKQNLKKNSPENKFRGLLKSILFRLYQNVTLNCVVTRNSPSLVELFQPER